MNEFQYFIAVIKETRIMASDGQHSDYFGDRISMSADGNSFVVGARGDDDNGSESGSVYVYKWNGTTWEETKITASDGQSDDSFGCSVSITADGNSFVVGADSDDDNGSFTGSVYVYRWNGTTWEETKITASDGQSADFFGSCVSITADGNSFVVGADSNDDNGTNSGSVYVYKWNSTTWEETKITASDGQSGDRFGNSVSISGIGNTIIVGAEYDYNNGTNSGSVYVYKWNGTTWEETKIIASDSDNFGFNVSVAGDGNILVAASRPYYGSLVYVYKWNGITWDETIISPPYSEFSGSSVSISVDGNYFLVGESYYNDTVSVFVYRWNGNSWEEANIVAPDDLDNDEFGYSVSISANGNTIAVGIPSYLYNSGAVCVYK